MATIKFESNLLQLQNIPKPWVFNPSYFEKVPKSPGVYIVGVKIPVNGQGEKFCPLYVGIRDNIKNRIKAHHKYNGYLNGKKELFDLNKPIEIIYSEIKKYNSIWMNSNKNSSDKLKLHGYLPNLIWFNNSSFFDNYLQLPIGTSQYRDNHDWHNGSLIKDLPLLSVKKQKETRNLINKINNTKKMIFDRFYYAYYVYETSNEYKTIKPNLEEIEAATKFALTTLNIHTTGEVSGKGKSIFRILQSKSSSKSNFNIDLSCIQNEIVNLSNPLVSNNNPLIIKL